jgi:hypothetical protein
MGYIFYLRYVILLVALPFRSAVPLRVTKPNICYDASVSLRERKRRLSG